jgi:hypothetical protein
VGVSVRGKRDDHFVQLLKSRIAESAIHKQVCEVRAGRAGIGIVSHPDGLGNHGLRCRIAHEVDLGTRRIADQLIGLADVADVIAGVLHCNRVAIPL